MTIGTVPGTEERLPTPCSAWKQSLDASRDSVMDGNRTETTRPLRRMNAEKVPVTELRMDRNGRWQHRTRTLS